MFTQSELRRIHEALQKSLVGKEFNEQSEILHLMNKVSGIYLIQESQESKVGA